MKKIINLFAVVLIVLISVPSIFANGQSDQATEEKPVELTFYMTNSPVKDLDRIMEKANEIIKEEINATLTLIPIDWDTYSQKVNLMIASGEPFDLAFSASWGNNNYFQNASKGAFYDLTELLPEIAPVSYNRVPEQYWDGVTVNGNIYGVINYQVWGMSKAFGVQLRKDLVDKYDFDWQSVEKWDDITPFLASVKEGEPGMIGFEYSPNVDNFADLPLVYGMEAVGDSKTPGWVKIGDGDLTVFNQYESQDYQDYLEVFHKWYEAGYIKNDAAFMKDMVPDRKAGRLAALYGQPYPDMVDMPETIGQIKMANTAEEDKLYAYEKRFTQPYTSANSPSAAIIAVGANSKNPVKALELIELLNTSDELYHLISYGEEGIDYNKIGDDKYEIIPDMYNFNYCEWEIGQSYGRYLFSPETDMEVQQRKLEIKYEGDRTGLVSPLMGFVFDVEPVKTQTANVSSVMQELLAALGSGSIDPQEYHPIFIEKMNKAGVNDIIAEKQRQIDAWVASSIK